MNTATKETISTLGRLKERSDFLRVGKAGHKWVSPTVIVQIAPAGGDIKSFGITITKKSLKKAVDRNRVKRRLRAAAAEVLPARLPGDMDCVLIGRPATLSADYQAILKDLRWCLKRLGQGA